MEKLVQEFVFLREKLGVIASHVLKNENIEAAFLIGCLHSICHNHANAISQLIPPTAVVPESTKEASNNEQPAV